MANKKISDLTAALSLSLTDKLEIETTVPSSENITGQMIVDLVDANSGVTLQQVLDNGSTASITPAISMTSAGNNATISSGYITEVAVGRIQNTATGKVEIKSLAQNVEITSNNADVILNADGYVISQAGFKVNYITDNGSNITISSTGDTNITSASATTITSAGNTTINGVGGVDVTPTGNVNLQPSVGSIAITSIDYTIESAPDIIKVADNSISLDAPVVKIKQLGATGTIGLIYVDPSNDQIAFLQPIEAYVDDAAAAVGLIPVRGMYYNLTVNSLTTRLV